MREITFCPNLQGPFLTMRLPDWCRGEQLGTLHLERDHARRLWKTFHIQPHKLVAFNSHHRRYAVMPRDYYVPNDTVPLSVTTPKGHVTRCRAPRTYDSEPTVVFDRYQRYRLYKFFRAHKYRRMEATLSRCELRDDTGTRYKYKTL